MWKWQKTNNAIVESAIDMILPLSHLEAEEMRLFNRLHVLAIGLVPNPSSVNVEIQWAIGPLHQTPWKIQSNYIKFNCDYVYVHIKVFDIVNESRDMFQELSYKVFILFLNFILLIFYFYFIIFFYLCRR